uniref:Uncharacterized protein n=1 Tax=viral metagenome TaxID=1070528 RepID=A0A6C0LRX6_9ZZZZ
MILYTEDFAIAKKYHMILKINTTDNVIIFTIPTLFYNVDYFIKLIESNMTESQTNEITFMLNAFETKIYINLMVMSDPLFEGKLKRKFIDNYLSTLDNMVLIHIYNQLDFHQHPLRINCLSIIRNYKFQYSIELYEWNKIHNFFDIKYIVRKLRCCLDSKTTLPPFEDEQFWSIYFDNNEYCKYNVHTWNILRQMNDINRKKYMERYIVSFNINGKIFLKESEIQDFLNEQKKILFSDLEKDYPNDNFDDFAEYIFDIYQKDARKKILFEPGNFSFHNNKDMLESIYKILTEKNLWYYIDDYNNSKLHEGLSNDPYYEHHSGASFSYCLITMQQIKTIGWENYVEEFINKFKKDLKINN